MPVSIGTFPQKSFCYPDLANLQLKLAYHFVIRVTKEFSFIPFLKNFTGEVRYFNGSSMGVA